ncbi:MAG: hypothetical protein ACFFD4_29335 [Candidatus Odinarchaeota archaeon]
MPRGLYRSWPVYPMTSCTTRRKSLTMIDSNTVHGFKNVTIQVTPFKTAGKVF